MVAGLLLGVCVMLSYGLPLLGILALTVLALARSWRPLPIAAAAALAVVGAFAALGFSYPDALVALRQRYWTAWGRPASYWGWAGLAALLFSAVRLRARGWLRCARCGPRPRSQSQLPPQYWWPTPRR